MTNLRCFLIKLKISICDNQYKSIDSHLTCEEIHGVHVYKLSILGNFTLNCTLTNLNVEI